MQQSNVSDLVVLRPDADLYHEDMAEPSRSVAALLLTGGKSRRMGRDKSQLIVEGSTLAVRTARLLLLVVDLALEVGPGVSGLPVVVEHSPGDGPLAALAEGCRALRERGHTGGALAIACDLPLLSESVLRLLVEWDSPGSVVPLVQGRPQPLCAKWGAHDLDDASRLVTQGVRSLQHLTRQPDVVLLDESAWGSVASEEQFFDVDTPDDLQRLGLTMQ
jgi:molybdopterin-guanine dinucleotide biosynthesis protein A